MGRREIGLIFILFGSAMAIASSLQEILATESNCHQKTNTEKHGEDGATNQIGRRNRACAITVSQAVAHGGGASRGGGVSSPHTVGGGASRGGGVSSPHTGGGSAVIPIYVAGSAQAQRRRGRPVNAGNRHENDMWLLVAAALAATAHL
ncbi:uncharacterized protein LOC111467612 isoform X1 [Cucurbita maxima]|uniref:Uncharacterized protein LOC111467612 isoform X1 n=1 Tax=Cucurbita maxima TaxID=3661 RepID=A0A6J1HUL7_CUCMA|nr:uncharacterized protein LOC111467612 isoform X1 [Cucurbita maxima]